jgi:CheY-like chemotaxis protein
MPQVDGMAFARACAALGPDAPRKLVLLSSLGAAVPTEASGLFAATVNKPVRPSVLRKALADLAAGARSTPVAAKPAPTVEKHHLTGLRVLVAEDNAVNQRLIRLLLQRLGLKPDLACDGREAVDHTRAQTYDLILMEVQMPELDGLQATRIIREELPRDRQPWIVALTANAMSGDAERCLGAGMDAYLAKPVQPERLSDAIMRAAARVRERRQGAAETPAHA